MRRGGSAGNKKISELETPPKGPAPGTRKEPMSEGRYGVGGQTGPCSGCAQLQQRIRELEVVLEKVGSIVDRWSVESWDQAEAMGVICAALERNR